MFERNRQQTEQGAISVEITGEDGIAVGGRLIIAAGRPLFDVLNGPTLFFEFEPFEGERQFVAKSSIRSVKLLAGPGVAGLSQRLRDLDGFDPYSILGIKSGTPFEDVRSQYLTMAKSYHPDRYSTVQLPDEVAAYLEGMSRRVNAAFAALEPALAAAKSRRSFQSDVVYVSPNR
ncbi:MAG: J domain-containing protein [Hyphomicrobiaceae bacterium]|nr:J domain-containing protein [Hyphomicrobiaceae bacterium]